MLAADDALFPGATHSPEEALLAPWRERLGDHEGPLDFWRHFGLGQRGDGLLNVCDPAWLEPVLDAWLGGAAPNRTPLGFTGLGDIIYFRDLSERARSLELDEETIRTACDISLVCTRYKRITLLATSMDEFLESLTDEDWVNELLARPLYQAAVRRTGVPSPTEILGFVPALALGGSEEADRLEKNSAPEHWDILLQL